MSENTNPQNRSGRQAGSGKKYIRLPDGSYGVYMGETGTDTSSRRRQRPASNGRQSGQSSGKSFSPQTSQSHSPQNNRLYSPQANQANSPREGQPYSPQTGRQNNGVSGRQYAQNPRNRSQQNGQYQGSYIRNRPMTPERYAELERRRRIREMKMHEAEVRRRESERRKTPSKKEGTFGYYADTVLHYATDRIHTWWLGLSVDIDEIFRGIIIGVLIVIFAMLQTTFFSNFRIFGAVPDLMLPLVVSIGVCEGEKWGGFSALAAAFVIEALGGVGFTLLPLLYVPCGFTAGYLGTYYYRDSIPLRMIYTFASGILKAVFTVVYVCISYEKINAGIMFGDIVLPEFGATAIMSFLPHVAVWYALKVFHKSRADKLE